MTEHLQKFVAEQARRLEEVGIDQAKAEVELILCYLLECDRLHLYLDGMEKIDNDVREEFEDIMSRRLTREPLQFILEEGYFYGRTYHVTPAVMAPTPETELTCETVINFVNDRGIENPRILDIGAGSGVITVTLANEIETAHFVSVDISEEALAIAKRNADQLGGAKRIDFRKSDFFSAIGEDERFDVIVSNPPYIADVDYDDLPPEVKADPRIAMTSGAEGMDAISVIIREGYKYLAPGGRIMFEMGYDQAEKVAAIVGEVDAYTSFSVLKDLNDLDRIIILGCD